MSTAITKPSFSFKRAYRLTTKAEYTAVFNEPLKISQAWFLVLYKKNHKTHPRIGIIISKRIIKKATARNYLKRLIREGFRKQQAKMENLDCLILARRGCTLENKIKLRQELATLWQSLLAC